MSYIGSTPTTQSFIAGTDYFNGNGSTTAFTLSRPVVSVNDIQAVVNNVVQVPNDAYNVSGSTITFTSAPSSGTGNVYVRYMSTTTQSITPSQNTVSYSTLNTDLQSGGYASNFKNRLINGAMVIDQRNAGAAVTTSGSYPVDRFAVGATGSATFTLQRSSTAPTGFINSVIWTTGTASAPTSTQQNNLSQGVEGLNVYDFGWGTASAATVTLSFWVRSSLTGTFCVSITNNSRSYPATYVINAANTWEYKTITIAGDTSGTWVTTNDRAFRVVFDYGTGSNRAGTANTWQAGEYTTVSGCVQVCNTSGATFYITGVQLEKGSTATSFDYRPYGTELALCQRYYYKTENTGNGVLFSYGFAPNTTSSDHNQQLIVSMRTAPTVGFSSVNASTQGGTTFSVSAIATGVSSPNQVRIITTTSGLTSGSPYFLRANTTGYIDFSSEL